MNQSHKVKLKVQRTNIVGELKSIKKDEVILLKKTHKTGQDKC